MIRLGPLLGTALTIIALGPAASPAEAAEIVTWDGKRISQSRFVDPTAAPPGSYNEPPGVEERPNALRANIYLPDGYRKHPGRRYPVLFLLHGVGDAYDSWVHPEQGNLMAAAAGFEGIIVMPEGDRGFYTDWWNGGRRGAPAWERYFLEQLLPLVRKRLRVRHGRRWHAIAGLSMGGGGALYLASQRPGYFGSVAAFSAPTSIERTTYQQAFDAASGQDSAAIYGDPSEQEFYWSGHNPIDLVPNLRSTRLYIATGNGIAGDERDLRSPLAILTELELSQHAAEFVAAARGQGIDLTYRPRGGVHSWRYWSADLTRAIDWGFFESPPRANRSWEFSTVAQRGRVFGLGYRFESPPDEVVTFTRSGDRLRGEGSGTVGICTRGGGRLRRTLPFDLKIKKGSGRSACGRG